MDNIREQENSAWEIYSWCGKCLFCFHIIQKIYSHHDKTPELIDRNFFFSEQIILVCQFDAAKVGSVVDYEHENRVDGG